MASSSVAAAHVPPPRDKYDVFLSFRGPDTRWGFTNYLYEALIRRKIHTYIDDRIEKGDEITKALEEAIEQSKISIIVFSKSYASSSWCLDELVHILECKERYGRIALPVFYQIEPTDIRRQTGSYADAFVTHERRYEDNMDKVRNWRAALSTAAEASGFPSTESKTEVALVEEIVNDVSARLNSNSPIIVPGLVGVKSQIQQIESLLCIEAQEIKFRVVGLWGMGGIGKTTLADAVHHRLSSKFEACAFLLNVREQSEKRGIDHVRDELLRQLLNDKNINIKSPSIGSRSILDRLSRTKALVVLDDVNESEQLDYLLGQQVAFGFGSRVIITARDRRPLTERVNDDHIYQVTELNDADALELFHSKASKDGASKIDNPYFLREVISYAKGIPLLLKVLGSSFRRCNGEKDCEDKLKILKMSPDKKSQDLLRVGYGGLGKYEQGIFLDIACFFKGEKKHDAERLMEMHGFCAPAQGISVLVDMSLISISKDDRLQMHDLVQEMGMAIVREEPEPGRRTRLWSDDDIYRVLRSNTGSPMVEVIWGVGYSMLSRTSFTDMHRLRLLKVYGDSFEYGGLPQGLETLPESLRYLYWVNYCLESLPLEFLPCNLVELHMPGSSIKKLWGNGKNLLPSLKVIDLSHSDELCEVPDLSESPNIEEIKLRGCINLVELPSYFKNLHKLTSLILGCCRNLETFPDEMPCNLRFLELNNCRHLTRLPDLSRCAIIEKIDLSYTKVVEIPSYFQHLDKLNSLLLRCCSEVEYIPNLPINVECLKLSNCGSLKELANGNYRLNRLETLNLHGCGALEKLPPQFSVGLRSLRKLSLGYCKILEIPDGLICLPSLRIVHLEGTRIESIPGNIKNASGLRILNIAHCKKLRSLPELPPLIEKLDASGCTSLQRASSRKTVHHQYEGPYYRTELVKFFDCINLDESSRSNIMQDARCRIMEMASSKAHKITRPDDDDDDDDYDDDYCESVARDDSFTVCYPGNEIPEWFCSYRGEDRSVEFEFSPDWSTDFLGFALCAVVARVFSDGATLFSFECIFKTNNGECYDTEGYSYAYPTGKARTDHVVWYFIKLRHSADRGNPIPFTEVTNASFHFFTGIISALVILKACGIRLLYAHDSGGSSSRPYRVVSSSRPPYRVVTTDGSSSGSDDPTDDDLPLLQEEQPQLGRMDFDLNDIAEDPEDFEQDGLIDCELTLGPRKRTWNMMGTSNQNQDGTTSDDDPN